VKRRTLPLGAITLALQGSACGGGTEKGEASAAAAPVSHDGEYRRQAHARAAERFLSLAEPALALADPLAARALGDDDRVAYGFDRAYQEPLRAALDAAFRQGEEIDERSLDPRQRVLLRTTRQAVDAAREHTRRRPWRVDPTFTTEQALRTSEAIESGGLPANRKVEALDAIGRLVDVGLAELTAASLPTIVGALEDLTDLDEAIRRMVESDETLHESATRCRSTIASGRDRLTAIQRELASPEPDPHTPVSIERLPPRLGAAELKRRLDAEEGIARSAHDLFRGLGPTLDRFQAMRRKRASPSSSEPKPVDRARCEGVAAKLDALDHPEPDEGLDCTIAVQRWTGRNLTDAELLREAIRVGAVEPFRQTRRRAEPRSLGLASGSIAAYSQLHSRSVAILAALADDEALVLGIAEATEAACLAAAALWIHGELGTDEKLHAQLATRCSDRPPSWWVEQAEQHPRRTLQGLELWRLGAGPAAAAALDQYWWLPAGLIDGVALPEAPAPPSPPVKVTIEPIVPQP